MENYINVMLEGGTAISQIIIVPTESEVSGDDREMHPRQNMLTPTP